MTAQFDHQPALEPTTSSNPRDILDPATRRRLQNRLNQRASRKRKALESKTQHKTPDRKWIVYVDDSNIPKRSTSTEEATSHQVTQLSLPLNQNEEYLSYFKSSECDAFMNKLYGKALHTIENPVLSRNPTVCDAQFNVFRAISINANLMGLTFDLLNEDIASQFNLAGPLMSAVHLPASLFPSQKQRKIIHHPWIDLIPMLSLREALLIRVDVIDEDELCVDFYGTCAPSQEVGLRVWGEAWDPFAYEFSEAIIRKWRWMATDCPDIVKSSNYWRRQRGEKPIVFEVE
ncbi:hypothetical protein N7516_001445 [Penicillium verrucosum]|uniref:uncharacterized protein n=1 Tax=Penicillium verrucosum TaxID=60171 RepID=UPI002544F459|nr:uncharacterized protein N7516_001445 [Penicillium verrucosum]KAJ5941277.1 hypothetical protein N7516_001445 [Penicillium verrucosum]